jgi:hypothetical protein
MAGEMDVAMLAPIIAAAGVMIVFVLILLAAFYVYFALALMTTANRLKEKNAWLAWIPVANLVLMARMARMHWWPVLLCASVVLFVIPLIGGVIVQLAMIVLTVFGYIWTWKICERRNRPGWWALLQLIPFVGGIWTLVMWGILAWGKK